MNMAASVSNSPVSPRLQRAIASAATPLAIATFVLCGGTGLLLVFDTHQHVVKEVHYWASVAFAGAMVLHLMRHARAIATQFKRWPVWAALAGVAVLGVATVLTTPEKHQGRGEHRGWGQQR